MVELFPEGFEEVEKADGVELVVYTDGAGEERVWHAFGGARSEGVADGWEDRWREFHRPVRIGSLWVGPPWLEPPVDALPVVIDPGRSFGTGAHATTRLCLELLLELPRGSLVDVGCGSGVLAIAAARLGFSPVWGVDSDDAAVEAARLNAERNGVRVDVRLADALSDPLPVSDSVVANLTREQVEQLGRRVRAGLIVTSGYPAAEHARLAGYRTLQRLEAEGWAAEVFARGTE
jgi:ribosomal protein L11 methyltransferase